MVNKKDHRHERFLMFRCLGLMNELTFPETNAHVSKLLLLIRHWRILMLPLDVEQPFQVVYSLVKTKRQTPFT